MKKIPIFTILLFTSVAAYGQGPIRLPEASPAASVSQTIGITDVSINYHRPAMNKRTIFGGLVPYDTIWRTGANENTTISFSTPVKIEGQALPAGTYAFYAIPTASQWTLIFSKFTGDWGVYNYDASEDVLRVKVTPQTLSNAEERLTYSFDDVTNSSANASVRWDKLRVPMKIEVDLPSTVRSSIQSQLRGGKHWDANAWAAAARWELRNGTIETASAYADHAVLLGINSNTLRTKAFVLDKKGDAKGAAEYRERAKAIQTDSENIGLGYGPLVGQKKYDEAIAFLNNFATAHPQTTEMWRIYAGLGEVYAAKGDDAKSKEYFDKAMAAAHDTAERTEVWDSINQVMSEKR
jgi:hypothetical protein